MRRATQARPVPAHPAGFTIVEVVVTIAVAALFIIAITQLHIVQSRVVSSLVAFDTADVLAYNNLRAYAYGKAPTWFDCDYDGSTPKPMTLINSTEAVEGIPSPVIQTVVATAPYGCGGGSASIGYPIRVVSKIVYGEEGKVIVHATYATY